MLELSCLHSETLIIFLFLFRCFVFRICLAQEIRYCLQLLAINPHFPFHGDPLIRLQDILGWEVKENRGSGDQSSQLRHFCWILQSTVLSGLGGATLHCDSVRPGLQHRGHFLQRQTRLDLRQMSGLVRVVLFLFICPYFIDFSSDFERKGELVHGKAVCYVISSSFLFQKPYFFFI